MKLFVSFIASVILTLSVFSQGNGYLGISMEKAPNEGVRISEILKDGAAKVYELKQNDIILQVNGVVVNNALELKNQIKSKNWGETISLILKRNEKSILKKVTLGNKAMSVTYEVRRKVMGKETEWVFDKSTWIIMENGEVKSIKKKLDGKEKTLVIVKGKSIPQEFSDLEDKKAIIEHIIKRNEGKKRFPTITVYIKKYVSKQKKEASSIEEKKADKLKIKAYPNPSLGDFQFSLNTDKALSSIVKWEIIDITGKKILKGEISNFTGQMNKNISLTEQSAGTYLLKVVYNNSVYTERMEIK